MSKRARLDMLPDLQRTARAIEAAMASPGVETGGARVATVAG